MIATAFIVGILFGSGVSKFPMADTLWTQPEAVHTTTGAPVQAFDCPKPHTCNTTGATPFVQYNVQHNLGDTTHDTIRATQHVQHNLCNTICATQSVQHNLCNTICATQHVQHNLCNTICATQSVQHNLCNTTCLRVNEPSQQCTSVPTMECNDAPKEKCGYEPKQVCNQAPKEKCGYEPKQVCNQVHKEKCWDTPRQWCHDVPKEECAPNTVKLFPEGDKPETRAFFDPVPRQKCNTEYEKRRPPSA